MRMKPAILLALLLVLPAVTVAEGEIERWRVTFESQRFGPAEAVLLLERQEGALRLRNVCGACPELGHLPGVADAGLVVRDSLLAVSLTAFSFITWHNMVQMHPVKKTNWREGPCARSYEPTTRC